MPQVFQVLTCYKCSVFQVHQTKKTNKWECKLCGEKQSIKRHYGLGTGKECRVLVQKLNRIRGEIEERCESSDHTFDEDVEVKPEMKVKSTNNESKWSNFIDEDDVPQPDKNEAMYLGNAEVVLEVPKKKRKFNNPKIVNTLPGQSIKPIKTIPETQIKLHSSIISNTFPELDSKIGLTLSYGMSELQKDENNQNMSNIEVSKIEEQNQIQSFERTVKTTKFVPPKVGKDSKWAKFTEDKVKEALNMPVDNEAQEKSICNIFSLCDESEIDSVLTI